MTHLYIEQATDKIEEVNSSIISKLYELAINGDLDLTSDLKGRLHSTSAKDAHVAYLNEEFDDLYITADTLYMTFADPQVEQIILNQGWGDGVGVTTQDLGLIITFSESVFSNSNITSFNEYKYFAKATTLSSAFYGCSNLTSIEYPPASTLVGNDTHLNNTSLTHVKIDNTQITSIGGGAFKGCSSLLNMTLPSTCTSIGLYAFNGCTSLTTIDLSNCNTIGKQAFQNCSSLTSVLLSTNLTTIPLGCFMGCSNLTNIDLSNVEIIDGDWLYGAFLDCSGLTSIDLSSCTSIGNSCFMRCTSLQVSNTQNVTSIGNACFYGCSSITELYMPNADLTGPTQNNKNNFGNCTLLSKITLGDCVTLGNDFSSKSEWNVYFLNCTSLHTVDVKSLQTVPNNAGDAVFKNCPNMRNFIIRSTTVPTVQNNGNTLIKHFGGSSVKIYVPDAAVNDYKNATGWSNVSDYIYPLSQYSAS